MLVRTLDTTLLVFEDSKRNLRVVWQQIQKCRFRESWFTNWQLGNSIARAAAAQTLFATKMEESRDTAASHEEISP